MKTFKKFYIPIYDFNLYIGYSMDLDTYKKCIKRYAKFDVEQLYQDENNELGLFLGYNTDLFIWYNSDTHKNLGIVIHEIFHAVSYIMDNVGIILTIDSEEAFCYLLEFITNIVTKFIKS